MSTKKTINNNCWYVSVCSKLKQEGCNLCIKYAEMNYLMTHSNLPPAKQNPITLFPTTDNDEKMFKKLDRIRKDIYNFVQEGENLYITSYHTGNGKTSWAIKLLHKYFEEVWDGNGMRVRGMFVHVPTLLSELKNFNNPLSESFKNDLKTCDVVVWDDIACDMVSNFDITQLTIFIDNRILAEKSNIYTGNIQHPQNMRDILGSRLASRIYNSSIVIELNGEDNRDGRLTNLE